MKYYKVLNNNHSCIGSNMDWTPYLPKDGQPGKWTPKIAGKLELCNKGYHLTDTAHLLTWCQGNQLFEAETKWKILVGDDKVACRQVRLLRQVETWNDKNLRLFACWCVRKIWHLLTDERSRNAVVVAEKYANGDATQEELAAAWDAARAAAWAARAAAGDAQSKKLIEMLGLDAK